MCLLMITILNRRRLEAERKLRSLPESVLEIAWIREAQVEAVVDAVLAVTYAGNAAAYAHARHMGEWCARIAKNLTFGPDPSFARRVGVLAEADPQLLSTLPELEAFSIYVRAYQTARMEREDATVLSLVMIAADEFERCISAFASGHGPSPKSVLVSMLQHSSQKMAAVFEALERAVQRAEKNVA